MFYKVIKDNKVIDVLNQLIFLKYRPKRKIMVLCKVNEAQAVLSSDGDSFWHGKGMYPIPAEEYEAVEIVPIDEYEYKKLKMLNYQTAEEIIDAFLLSLMEGGVI